METKTNRLSPAQRRFLNELEARGDSTPPWGFRSAGRAASAWHRTATSLQNLGLVTVRREGGGFRATKAAS